MSEISITELPFADRLAMAQPGEILPYRGPAESLRGCRHRKEVLRAADAGLVDLVQRRLMPNQSLFVYCAIKKGRAS
jgi:hypothetical protein